MANDVEGSASIRIEPDMSGFETTLLSELRSVLDTATDAITAAFKDASSEAAEALGGIGTGFDATETAAVTAAAAVGTAFASAAEQVNADLSSAGEGAGSAIASEFDSAAGAITSSMSGAAAEADEALSGIGAGVSVDIPVTLDTGDAEEQAQGLGEELGGIGSGAEQATESVQTLSTATGDLSNAVNLGSGSLSGLQGILAGVSPEAKLATGALAGVGAVLGALTTSGTKTIESQKRFNDTFGQFAKQITDVNIGSLNGQLGDLAKNLGSGTGGLRDAATSIGQFGQAAGKSQAQVAVTSEQVLALALRVRALKPELGDAGSIAEGLTTALARGGRASAKYGISLTSAEIAARGVELGLAATGEQLTQFDKLMAGADLTAARLGGTLGSDVAAGSEALSIRWDRLSLSFRSLITDLGKQTAIPVLELMEQIAPAGLTATKAIGGVAISLLPLFQGLGFVAELIAKIPTGFLTLALTAATLSKVMPLLSTGLGTVVGHLGKIAQGGIGAESVISGLNIATVAATVVLFGFAQAQAEAAANAAAFAALVAAATDAFTDEEGQIRLTTDALVAYVKELARSGDGANKIAELSGGYKGLAQNIKDGEDGQLRFNAALKANDIGGLGGNALRKAYEGIANSVEEAARQELIAAGASHALTDEQVDQALASDNVIRALGDLDPQIQTHNRNIALLTAKYGPFVDAITVAGGALDALTGSSPAAANAIATVADGIGPINQDLLGLATTLDAAKLSEEDMGVAAVLLGTDVESLQGFIDGVTGALTDFVSTATGALPTVADAFKQMGEDIEGTKIDESKILSPAEFIENLQTATAGMDAFLDDLKRLTAEGFGNIAGEIAKQGPEIGGGLADSLVTSLDKGNRLLVETADKAVADFNNQWNLNVEFLRTTLGPQFILQSGLIASLASSAFANLDFASGIRLAGELAKLDLDAQGKAIVGLAFTQGTAAAIAYGVGVGGMDEETVQAILDANQALIDSGPGLKDTGWGVGADVVDGMDEGVRARMKVLIASLQKTGRDMIAVVKATIDAQSPSREFMKIGHMVTDGLALGIDQGGRDVVAAAEAITRAAVSSSQDIFDRIGAAEGTTGLDVRLGGGGTLTDESARLRQQLADSGGPAFSLNGATPAQSFTVGSMPITVQVSGDVSDARAREIGTVVGDAAHQRMLALVDREVTAETRLAGL